VSRPRLPDLATQEVIPWGIDVARVPSRRRRPAELSEWVYVGQLEEHKGPQVAIEAVRLLREAGEPVRLTLYGGGGGFATELRERVAAAGLTDRVRFVGQLAPEHLWHEVDARGGLLVFPTLWDEPFSLTLLEAFAARIPVMCTQTGGTGELVDDGETATVVRAGDAANIADAYRAVRAEPERVLAMADRARTLVEAHLDIERMVDRVETHLLAVATGRGSQRAEVPGAVVHPWETPAAPLEGLVRD
jgi:glycosyltransferase involved in cell wall biosynthesis